jgi:hypothetical protein
MKKFVLALALLGVGLMAVPAHADMTYTPFLFDGKDANGNAIANGTYAMILDLDGDGFNGNSYLSISSAFDNSQSWLWDQDDLLMDIGQITDGAAFPFSKITTDQIPSTYTPNSDQYYLLWFDTAFQTGSTGPGTGVNYGAESLGTVGTNPGDYTPFAVGGLASLKTFGSTTTVPEPVSIVLALIGGGAMALRRRFGRMAV